MKSRDGMWDAGRRWGLELDEIRRPRVTGTSAKKDCHIRFSQSGSGVKIKKPCYSAEAARGCEMEGSGFCDEFRRPRVMSKHEARTGHRHSPTLDF